MKKLLFGIALLTAFALVSCNKTDENKTPFSISFKVLWDGNLLEKNTEYDYDTYKVLFTRITTYLANIELVNGNEKTRLTDIEYLDFTPTLAPDNKTVEVTLQYDVEPGDYDAIEIGFGVPSDLNQMAPNNFPADHPLALENEYWLGWRSYIFNKIEGTVDLDVDGFADGALVYHCGSDDVYRTYRFDHNISVTEGAGMEIHLDLKDLFTINGEWFDLNVPANRETSNDAANVITATILMDNLVNAVHIHE